MAGRRGAPSLGRRAARMDTRGSRRGGAPAALPAAGPGALAAGPARLVGQATLGNKTPRADKFPQRDAERASRFRSSPRAKRYLGCLRNNKSQQQTIKFTITGVTEA